MPSVNSTHPPHSGPGARHPYLSSFFLFIYFVFMDGGLARNPRESDPGFGVQASWSVALPLLTVARGRGVCSGQVGSCTRHEWFGKTAHVRGWQQLSASSVGESISLHRPGMFDMSFYWSPWWLGRGEDEYEQQ